MERKVGRYRLSPLAELDLENIWDYTVATWSVQQAERYHTDIMDAVEALAKGAKVGRDASDIRAGYTKYAVGRHFLFYVLSDDGLDVIRVLHQQMDVERHFEG